MYSCPTKGTGLPEAEVPLHKINMLETRSEGLNEGRPRPNPHTEIIPTKIP